MPNLSSLIQFHQDKLVAWATQADSFLEEVLQTYAMNEWGAIEANHAYNYLLWCTEDRARREDKGAEYVYQAKRAIDRFNQARNNEMEAIDGWMINLLVPAELTSGCSIHSETPGMMIDRLSILTLKHYHMGLQIQRMDVDELHRIQCQHKYSILAQQRAILLDCLLILIEEVRGKRKTFAVYRQFKMYNDAALNPQLYDPSG